MQTTFFFKVSLAAFTSLFLLSACQSTENKDPKNVAEEHNEAKFDKVAEKDAQSVVEAYTIGLYEIRMADTVKKYGTSAGIKSMAAMLGDEHSKINDELKVLAAKKQITLPTDISSNQLSNIKELGNENRVDFDKKYANIILNNHKDAVSMFEKYAEECTDKDIKKWFATALPELRNHLDMIMTNERKMKEIK